MRHGDGHSWLKWMGHFAKMSYCFWEIFVKNTSLQGSTLSGHRMTTKERGWRRRKGEAKGEELPRKGIPSCPEQWVVSFQLQEHLRPQHLLRDSSEGLKGLLYE